MQKPSGGCAEPALIACHRTATTQYMYLRCCTTAWSLPHLHFQCCVTGFVQAVHAMVCLPALILAPFDGLFLLARAQPKRAMARASSCSQGHCIGRKLPKYVALMEVPLARVCECERCVSQQMPNETEPGHKCDPSCDRCLSTKNLFDTGKEK
jgi:hypothetical protein